MQYVGSRVPSFTSELVSTEIYIVPRRLARATGQILPHVNDSDPTVTRRRDVS